MPCAESSRRISFEQEILILAGAVQRAAQFYKQLTRVNYIYDSMDCN